MGLRRKASTLDVPFKRNEVVMATEDLPGVPRRSAGKVKLVAGFTWKRYWVFFDNGVQIGTLDNDQLVRPRDWESFLAVRAERESAAAAAAAAAAAGTATEDEDSGAAAADDNSPAARLRALVPGYLLERSADARTRLGA